VGACHGRERVFIVVTDPRSEHGIQWRLPASGETTSRRPLRELAGRGREGSTALLPTPTARDWKDGSYVEAVDENALLGRTVWRLTETFAEYAPAVAHWAAVLGRPAPSPTEPTGKRTPRLSPRFVEWMQGLPQGWVTDVPGLTRNEALKALGNGVVPMQAEAALRHMVATAAAA
jgi:DNA (cytosine-5)-methyltransferase 1